MPALLFRGEKVLVIAQSISGHSMADTTRRRCLSIQDVDAGDSRGLVGGKTDDDFR